MNNEIYATLRRTCVMMAVFAGSFILVYGGVVALTKFVYIYFRGFIPDFNENILRAIFYALSIGSFAASRFLYKKRYSPEGLKARLMEAIQDRGPNAAIGVVTGDRFIPINALERRLGINDLTDPLEVPGMIRLDVPSPVGFEYAGDRGGKIVLNESPFVVPFFGPRIGVIEMQYVQARVGQMVLYEPAGVGPHDADIFNAAAGHSVSGEFVELVGPLDSEQAGVGIHTGPSQQKPSLSAADLELEGTRRVEPRHRLDNLSVQGRFDHDGINSHHAPMIPETVCEGNSVALLVHCQASIDGLNRGCGMGKLAGEPACRCPCGDSARASFARTSLCLPMTPVKKP